MAPERHHFSLFPLRLAKTPDSRDSLSVFPDLMRLITYSAAVRTSPPQNIALLDGCNEKCVGAIMECCEIKPRHVVLYLLNKRRFRFLRDRVRESEISQPRDKVYFLHFQQVL